MRYKNLYVLGGGGHAKVILDALIKSGASVTGIIDPRLPLDSEVFGVRVTGGDELMATLDPQVNAIANGVGATPKNFINKKLFEIWTASGFHFISVIHPSAIIGEQVVLHDGCQIMARVVLQPNAQIGMGSVINTASSIDHDCVIGQHCFIAPSVTLCGGATVGDNCFIGAGATLLPGITVGSQALIAAGAVVDKNIGEGEFFPR